MTWRITAHALKRIMERYGVERKQAANWANQHMSRAKYVCKGVDESGTPCRIYTIDKKMFCADLIDDVICTVFDAQIKRPIAPSLAGTLAREPRKMEIAVLKREQAVIAERAPIEAEIVTLRLSAARAKTDKRRLALEARVTELESQLRQLNADLLKEKRELALFAEGYAAVM